MSTCNPNVIMTEGGRNMPPKCGLISLNKWMFHKRWNTIENENDHLCYITSLIKCITRIQLVTNVFIHDNVHRLKE